MNPMLTSKSATHSAQGPESEKTNATSAIGKVMQEVMKTKSIGIKKIHPKHVRRGPFANRMSDFFDTPEFQTLKQRIHETKGNSVPACVVETPDKHPLDGHPIYEIVYGHCRHEACSQLSQEVIDGVQQDYLYTAEVYPTGTPYTELARLMRQENQGRTEPTPWEDATWYFKLISAGKFSTARTLAFAIGEPESTIARYVRVASEFDPRLIDLISNERLIPLQAAARVTKFKAENEEVYQERLELATKEFNSVKKKFTYQELFDRLTAIEQKKKVTLDTTILKSKTGDELGTYKKSRDGGMRIDLDRPLKPEGIAKLAELIQKYKEPSK